eukprot:COSAG06_NODE_8416_length_2181_cov_1.284822_3_plen_48_part_00
MRFKYKMAFARRYAFSYHADVVAAIENYGVHRVAIAFSIVDLDNVNH